MLLTEEQARTKWCPHVRYGLNHDASPAYCIASDCSQWQLAALVHDHDAETFAEFYFSTEEQRTMWARQFDGIDSVTVTLCGYCGLAGKP